MVKSFAGSVLKLGIGHKIAGMFALALGVTVSTLSYFSLNQQKATLEQDLHNRMERSLQSLAAAGRDGLLSGPDRRPLEDHFARMRRRADVSFAAVYDLRGEAVAEFDRELHPAAAPQAPAIKNSEILFAHRSRGSETFLEASVPVYAAADKPSARLGTARLTLSERNLQAALARHKRAFLAVAAASLAAGLLLAMVLGHALARPIRTLCGVMEDISDGNLNRVVRVRSHDEIGTLARTFNRMILRLREKEIMEKYLSRSTLQQVKRMRYSERLKLGGERRQVAVLFTDIRGFTEMSESLPAEEVVATLNVYLNTQAEVIHKRGGVVDKFIGDAVMAIFTDENAEFRAALCAQEICNFVDSLNEARRRKGLRLMSIGVGLNSGWVVMGNMGSERQMDYTVVGDPINVASRLCGQARRGQVVMSWPILSAIAGRCRWGMLPPMPVKGKSTPLEVYELKDLPGAARRHMRRRLDSEASLILGANERHSVKVHEISRTGCSIESPMALENGKEIELDLRLNFLPLGRVRAVVLNLKQRDGWYRAGLRFSGLAEEMAFSITEWVHHIDLEMAAA